MEAPYFQIGMGIRHGQIYLPTSLFSLMSRLIAADKLHPHLAAIRVSFSNSNSSR